MKTYKEVPQQPRKQVSTITCDLCRHEWEPSNSSSPKQVYVYDFYRIEDIYQDIEVRCSESYSDSYGDGNDAKSHAYDLCASCFVNKLEPWLKIQGASPTIKDRMY